MCEMRILYFSPTSSPFIILHFLPLLSFPTHLYTLSFKFSSTFLWIKAICIQFVNVYYRLVLFCLAFVHAIRKLEELFFLFLHASPISKKECHIWYKNSHMTEYIFPRMWLQSMSSLWPHCVSDHAQTCSFNCDRMITVLMKHTPQFSSISALKSNVRTRRKNSTIVLNGENFLRFSNGVYWVLKTTEEVPNIHVYFMCAI